MNAPVRDQTRLIGKGIPRREDERMLTGHGRFTDDVRIPGLAYAAVLRSQHGHARILSIDASPATAMPGVVGVLTSADLVGKVGDIKPNWVVGKSIVPPHPPLATDRVRYVGEPVAFIVADTREAANDALEAIDVEYEQLPCNVDPLKAMASVVEVMLAAASWRVPSPWGSGSSSRPRGAR